LIVTAALAGLDVITRRPVVATGLAARGASALAAPDVGALAGAGDVGDVPPVGLFSTPES
jgi:hypothetical protein